MPNPASHLAEPMRQGLCRPTILATVWSKEVWSRTWARQEGRNKPIVLPKVQFHCVVDGFGLELLQLRESLMWKPWPDTHPTTTRDPVINRLHEEVTVLTLTAKLKTVHEGRDAVVGPAPASERTRLVPSRQRTNVHCGLSQELTFPRCFFLSFTTMVDNLFQELIVFKTRGSRP